MSTVPRFCSPRDHQQVGLPGGGTEWFWLSNEEIEVWKVHVRDCRSLEDVRALPVLDTGAVHGGGPSGGAGGGMSAAAAAVGFKRPRVE